MNSLAHVSWYAGMRVSLGVYQKVERLVRGHVVVNRDGQEYS